MNTSQVRSERCAAVTTAGRTVGKSQHTTIWKKGLSFFGGVKVKGVFFSSNFLWGEGEEHPVGSPRAVVFISDVEAMKICKEKITKFQVLFHKNSHDH